MRPSIVCSSLAFALVALAACGQSSTQPPGFCLANYTPAVIAIVSDSITGLSPAGAASGVAQSGSYVDTLRPWDTQKDSLAGGGVAGAYSVRVSLTGYADWTRSNIRVLPSGVCSELSTVTLHARLVPLP